MMSLCTIERCIRASFLGINIIFSLLGASMLIASCIVRYDQNTMDKYLDYSSFQMAMQSANVSVHTPTSLNMGEALNIICIVFIVIGVLFLLLGIFGIIGAVCKVKALLVTYAVLLLVLVMLEMICVVLLTTIGNKIEGWIKESLRDSIRDDYVGINGNDTTTLRWNFLMHSFKCCGVENYADFKQARKWDREIIKEDIIHGEKRLPFACCKVKNDKGCVRAPTSKTAYIDTGCYRVLRDWVADILVGVGASVLVIELALVIFAFIICCTWRKRADDDNDDKDPIQPYRVPHAHLRSRNSNLFYPGGVISNPVYRWYDSSVQMYPPRSVRELVNHNNHPIDAYDVDPHDQDTYRDSVSKNQSYQEAFERVPSRMSFTSVYSSKHPCARPGKDNKERTASFGISGYCG